MDSQIAKKIQSLTTVDDMRDQTKLVMQPYPNWEEYLTPAPLSISILGELVFISSMTDFSINKNPPRCGYKYIKYPDSFRACLMQVCNSGWRSFSDVYKNMDQIRFCSMAVPDYMKTAVKILLKDNGEVVQAHLRDQLKIIRVVADDCLELANSNQVNISIIQELCEACEVAEHFYREELNDIKKRLEEAKMRKYSSEKAMKGDLTEIPITIRNCEIKEIDFNTTIQMLVKGLDAMGRVKKQWEKTMCFFQMMSIIVKTSLTRTLKDFVTISEKIQSLSNSAKLFTKDLLYSQAFQAINIASLINMISATYTEVSNKYIMDSVSSLGKLMTMDKDKPEFLFECVQLQDSCDEAQKAILRLVLKNKQEFERESAARLEMIDKELLAIFPVAAGFTEEEEADYA